MNKTRLIIIGCILIVIVASVAQFLFPRRAIAPQPTDSQPSIVENNNATASESAATNTPASNSSRSVSSPILIAKGDSITSWNFKGAYADNPELIAKAKSEIDRFSNLVGKGTYTDMILFVSIANQYDLLGDGKQEYDYLNRAVVEGGETTGLPWHNLGVLMTRLGALQTARIAYEKATLVQSGLKQWHYAYLAFLTTHMKDNVALIEKEFTVAKENVGQDPDILQLYSEWKNL